MRPVGAVHGSRKDDAAAVRRPRSGEIFAARAELPAESCALHELRPRQQIFGLRTRLERLNEQMRPPVVEPMIDRKSTRLNSSHLVISYAVFCLKKKNATRSRPWAAALPTSAASERRRGPGSARPQQPRLHAAGQSVVGIIKSGMLQSGLTQIVD